jgi:hypothetical protein
MGRLESRLRIAYSQLNEESGFRIVDFSVASLKFQVTSFSPLQLICRCFVPFPNGTFFMSLCRTGTSFCLDTKGSKKSRLCQFFLWVPMLLPSLRNQTRSLWSLKQDCSTILRSRQKPYPKREN